MLKKRLQNANFQKSCKKNLSRSIKKTTLEEETPILKRVNKERASKKPVLKFNGDILVRDVSQKPKPEKKALFKHQLKEEFSNQNLGAES